MTAPQPLFVLCTMRSFSSLVCAMLGQHPEAYGLPELNLFVADDVGGVIRYYARRPHGLHGLLRTIAQLEFGGQDEATIEQARSWIEARAGWTGARLFEHVREAVAPRLCIDKSPVTVRDPAFLARLHRAYPDAGHLHLTRHPAPVGDSIRRLHEKADQARGTNLSGTVDPERVWLTTNRNIVAFTRGLPLGQAMHVQGEMLLGDLGTWLPQICEWLGLSTAPEALAAVEHPERSPYACPGPANAALGNDPNFLEHPAFDRRPIPPASLDGFSRPTLKLARELGYE